MADVDSQKPEAEDGTDPAAIEAFIGRWRKSGGSEMANFQPFAKELCALLGLPEPDPAEERVETNDYVFERRVDFKHDDGSTTRGRIDLYKRDCFVMEAKQSAKRVKARTADPGQPELIPEDATKLKPGTATRGTGRWDKVMRAAKRQAEDYARALPKEHGWPPFILVVDVGHVIEVYADFSGQGKNYASSRIGMAIPFCWKVCVTRPSETVCARSGAPLTPSIPPNAAPRLPATSQSVSPASHAAWKASTMPRRSRIPHALPLHNVRGGCRPVAREGV